MSARVRVTLRAPGSLSVDGVELVVSPAQWRMVAALATRRSGLTADELLLASGVASIGSLRTLVTGIRRQLEQHGVDGATSLRFGQGRYRLYDVSTDVDEESASIDRAAALVPAWSCLLTELRPLAEALSTGVSLAPLDDDDAIRAAHYERRRLDGLALLVESELREGSPATAMVLLEGMEISDLDEQFALLRAVADYKLGRQRQALHRLAAVRQALLEELGQPLSRAAQELEMAILRQDLSLAGWPDAAPEGPPRAWPLPLPVSIAAQRPMHGRASDLAALDVAASGDASLVRLTGPPGIGKSTLAAHWAATRHAAGATVLWAAAGEKQHEFGVFVQLVEQLTGPLGVDFRNGLEAADALLTQLRPLLDVVVVVDRADELSPGEAQGISLLLGGRRRRGSLTVVVEASGRAGAPFAELLLRESARGTAQSIEVGPLDTVTIATLLRERTHAEDSHQVRVRARKLFDTSGGNPLFVLLAIETDRELPEAMSNLLDLAFEAVGTQALEVLELASVLGRTFHVQDLSTILGRSVEVLTDSLAAAGRHGLVAEVALGEYLIVHSASRHRIVERMGPTREAVLHSRIIGALDLEGDPTSRLLHAVRALPITGERRAMADAVDHARRLIEAGQYRDALRLASASTQGATEWSATTNSEMVAVLAVHASSLEHYGDREGAKRLHDRAWDLAVRAGVDADLVTAACSIGVTGESMIPDTEHEQRLTTALGRCASPAERSSLALRVAQLALNGGHVDRARAVLERADSTTDLATHTRLLLERHLLDESPDLETRLALSRSAVRHAERAGDAVALPIAAAYRSTDLFASGRLAEAFESWNDEDRIAIDRPTPKERWFAAARRCFASQIGDQPDESTAYADAALNLGLELGYVDALAAYGVQLFCIRARNGGLHELVGLIEEQARTPGAPAAWQLGLARAVLEAGDVGGAQALLVDGLTRLRSAPGRFAAVGWQLAGQVVVDLPDRPRDVAVEVLGALAPWTGTFGVVGTSVGYLGPVDAILERLAAGLGDPRELEFAGSAQRLSELFNTGSRA